MTICSKVLAAEQLLSPSGSICVGHIAVSRPSLGESLVKRSEWSCNFQWNDVESCVEHVKHGFLIKTC